MGIVTKPDAEERSSKLVQMGMAHMVPQCHAAGKLAMGTLAMERDESQGRINCADGAWPGGYRGVENQAPSLLKWKIRDLVAEATQVCGNESFMLPERA